MHTDTPAPLCPPELAGEGLIPPGMTGPGLTHPAYGSAVEFGHAVNLVVAGR